MCPHMCVFVCVYMCVNVCVYLFTLVVCAYTCAYVCEICMVMFYSCRLVGSHAQKTRLSYSNPQKKSNFERLSKLYHAHTKL